MNLFSLKGKVAVVTGALGLLGKQHCYALAEAGANVVVTDLDDAAAKAFAEELSAAYQAAIGVGADITQPDSVKALRDATLAAFGTVDVLVNNAAINDMFENPTAAAELLKFRKLSACTFSKVAQCECNRYVSLLPDSRHRNGAAW
ncbi:MAG: SDR family NAD(P)-dependent oxidoreductase [Chloroherpetonaceae bacterium]|nr:SDR family NAD(P)-dependent oxidoreductase [Chloroherpetonaceae bacterium]